MAREQQKEIAGYMVRLSNTPEGEVPLLIQPYMTDAKKEEYLKLTPEQRTTEHYEWSMWIAKQTSDNIFAIVESGATPEFLNNEHKQDYEITTPKAKQRYLHEIATYESINNIPPTFAPVAATTDAAEGLLDLNMPNVNTNIYDTPSMDMEKK